MQSQEEVFEQVAKVGNELAEKKDELIAADLKAGFTYQSSERTIDRHVHTLTTFKTALKYIGGRQGVCQGPDEETALVMPFNITVAVCGPVACQMLLGNNIRVKPSPISVATYHILEDIWERHFPGRVRFDYSDAKEFMTRAIQGPKVKVVGAYGTDNIAMKYRDMVQQAGKKYFFEGPGKNPAIVLDDADPQEAAQNLFLLRFMLNSGQLCISPGRFYIHEDIFEPFTKALTEAVKSVVVGDPSDPKTNIGPLGSERAVEMIGDQLKDAVSKGAKIVQGGTIEGKLLTPTIVTNVNHDMIGMQAESFGPICWMMPYKTVEEVLALSKDSKYGLAATIFGDKDADMVKKALQGPESLHDVEDFVSGQFGMVEIDPIKGGRTSPEFTERMEYGAMGGYGRSGWVWYTDNGKFKLQQGPKSFALETSLPV